MREARKERGLLPGDLGLPYDDSMIRKIETGARKVAKDVAPMLIERLDDAAVTLAAIREFVGIGPAWLDGENVDTHRSAIRESCMREMLESIEAIERFATFKPPISETDHERKKRKEHLFEVLDSIVYQYMYVAVQCSEYGFSFKELHDAHYAKLRSLRLVSDTKKASGGNQRP